MARRLKPKQYLAAKMTAEGETDPYITYALKLRRNTLKRWRRVPEFYDAVKHYVEDIHLAAQYKLDIMEFTTIDALHTQICHRDGDASWLKQVMETWNHCRKLRNHPEPHGTKPHGADPSGTTQRHAAQNGSQQHDMVP